MPTPAAQCETKAGQELTRFELAQLTASEHRNQERWQLESHVASLHALLTAQTEMLESMTTANLDLRKEVERATAAVREAGNERRAAEVECERLTCEVGRLQSPRRCR